MTRQIVILFHFQNPIDKDILEARLSALLTLNPYLPEEIFRLAYIAQQALYTQSYEEAYFYLVLAESYIIFP